MSSYYAIAFTSEDIGQNRDVWFDIIFEEALSDTKNRLQRNPLREHEVIPIDVRLYKPSVSFPIIAEYETYSRVYFLNDGAMKLCKDGALDITVLNTISEEDLPEGLISCFLGTYLPY